MNTLKLKIIKTWISLILVGFFIPPSAFASINAGLSGGFTFSNYFGADLQRSNQYRISYLIGGFAEINFKSLLSLNPEVVYYKRGTIDDHRRGKDHYRTEIELSYLDFNLLIGYKLSKNISLLFGPYWSIYLDGKQFGEVNGYKNNFRINPDFLPKHDYGIIIGTKSSFFKYFEFGLRFSYGFQKLYETYANYYGVDPEPGPLSNNELDIRNISVATIIRIHLLR